MSGSVYIGPWTRELFAAAGASAPDALDRALDLGVDATLYRISPDPGHVAIWRAHLADTLARRSLHSELVASLDAKGVASVSLKGEPLARRLFDDPFARRSGDIDLLVALDDAPAAAHALRTLGFEPMHRDAPEPWISDEWPFVHPETGQVVELHWAIAAPYLPSPSGDDLIARAIGSVGSGARVLEPADCMLNLALHFHHHAGFFKGLVDVCAWLDAHDDVTLERSLERAESLGLLGVMTWPLRALERLTSFVAPPSASRSPLPHAFGAMTARSVSGVMGREEPLVGAHPLAFKTRGLSRAQVTMWHCACASLLDAPVDALRAIVWPVTRDPTTLARARGLDHPQALDWAHFLLRPALLVVGVLRDLNTGLDHP